MLEGLFEVFEVPEPVGDPAFVPLWPDPESAPVDGVLFGAAGLCAIGAAPVGRAPGIPILLIAAPVLWTTDLSVLLADLLLNETPPVGSDRPPVTVAAAIPPPGAAAPSCEAIVCAGTPPGEANTLSELCTCDGFAVAGWCRISAGGPEAPPNVSCSPCVATIVPAVPTPAITAPMIVLSAPLLSAEENSRPPPAIPAVALLPAVPARTPSLSATVGATGSRIASW